MSFTPAPLGLIGIVWSLGSHYVLPIVLSAAQLATSSLAPSGGAGALINSAKVLIHMASASVATLRRRFSGPTASSALRGKAEGLVRGATASARTLVATPASASASASEASEDSA